MQDMPNIPQVGTLIDPAALKLGDVVQISNIAAFGTAVVSKITDTDVYFFRPYAVTDDWSGTWGVSCSLAAERWSIPKKGAPILKLQDGRVELGEELRRANAARYDALRALRAAFHRDGYPMHAPKDMQGLLQAADRALEDLR